MNDIKQPDTPVQLDLYLSEEAYDALVKLQRLTGKQSLTETLRAAIELYHSHRDVESDESRLSEAEE